MSQTDIIQKELDQSIHYGRVFPGSGEQDKDDKECRFYQHGLYFGADFKVLLNNRNNEKKLEQLRALGGGEQNPDQPEPEVLTLQREPVNPRIMAAFDGKSDEDVLNGALRIVKYNADNGVKDDYEPTLDKRGDNLRFIAKHAG